MMVACIYIDDEICVTPDDRSAGTDVEEQFSPITSKTSFKNASNLTSDTRTDVQSTLAFTETPPDSLSPAQDDDRLSPIQQTLDVPEAGAIPLGVSPSDLTEDFDVQKRKGHFEIQEECLMCSYDTDASSSFPAETEVSLVEDEFGQHEVTHEYPVYDNLAFSGATDDKPPRHDGTDLSLKFKERDHKGISFDEISPEDLEKGFSVENLHEIDVQIETDVHRGETNVDTNSVTEDATAENLTSELKKQDPTSGDKPYSFVEGDESHQTSVQQELIEVSDIQHDTGDYLEEFTSSSSSSPDENEVSVLDEKTGTYVKLPWEIAYQYKRQISETYVYKGEDRGSLRAMKSIDMGSFYRREHGELTESSVTITAKDTQPSSSGPFSNKVRFAFSVDAGSLPEEEDLSPLHPTDGDFANVEHGTFEDTEPLNDVNIQTSEDGEAVTEEPHTQIDDTHTMIVLESIMQNRKAKMQDFDEHEEYEVHFQDSYTSTHDDEIEMREKRLSGSSFVSSGTTTSSSYTTALNSLESSTTSTATLQSDTTHYSDALSGEELFEREDVTTETSLTPTRENPPEFVSVVSKESRQAQQELLDEMSFEKDRSMSPSREITSKIPSSLIGTFPMALPSIGKAIADNAIYESSETGGDTTEEKLSPIEESAQDDFPEEEHEEAKPPVEKHVTFQTNVQHLHSVSSEDLVKTSTSSSEMEPTLLAASYDLESGRVSHVVTSFDMSPDTVEKQFVAPSTAKSILSSPEDDVFEADGAAGISDAESKHHLMVSDATGAAAKGRRLEKSSSSDSYVPSPPAPTPKETIAEHDTMPDLQGAAMKLQYAAEAEEVANGDETNIQKDTASPDDEDSQKTLKDNDQNSETDLIDQADAGTEPDEDSSSPFEVMSPSDLRGYEQYMEEMKKVQMMTSFDSITTASSSFTEVSTPDQRIDLSISFESTTAENVQPEVTPKSESSFDHSSPVSSEPSEKGLFSPLDAPALSIQTSLPDIIQGSVSSGDQQMFDEKSVDMKLPNGPTEVEYNPYIDLDEAPDQQQSTDPPDLVSSSVISADGDDSDIELPSTRLESGMQDSETTHTQSLMEELQAPNVADHLVMSDQTLYGLEMPSEETGANSVSRVDPENGI